MSTPSYQLSGSFLELCDCYTICPCWVDRPPDDGRCTGAFGWSIEEGTVGELDLAGRTVVSVSFHAGHRGRGGQSVTVFVDDGANDDQFPALVRTFTGKYGGPLGELGRLMGELRGAVRAPIAIASDGDQLSITVGRVVRGDASMMRGPDGGITELHSGRLSQVLGPVAEVGTSTAFRIDLGGQSASIEVTGRAAMRGTFRYEGAGEP